MRVKVVDGQVNARMASRVAALLGKLVDVTNPRKPILEILYGNEADIEKLKKEGIMVERIPDHG